MPVSPPTSVVGSPMLPQCMPSSPLSMPAVPKQQSERSIATAERTDEEKPGDDSVARKPTLLMLRNLPNKYTKAQLIERLDTQGLKGCYNFVYVPTDFWTRSCFGHGFVSFVSHEDALRAHDCFQGFRKWSVPSKKVCEVSWGR